jgi:hypothetical protein
MWTRIYAVVGSLVLLGYGTAAWMGWEFGTMDRETPSQAAARHASGGHRSHSVWIFRGGK